MINDRNGQMRIALLQLRKTYAESIANLLSSIRERTNERRTGGDLVDDVQQASAISVDADLVSNHHDILVKIDQALVALDHGDYGICRECFCEIALVRLKAVPFAHYCRDCQERAEQLHARTPRLAPSL